MNTDFYRYAALAALFVLIAAALYIYRPTENRLTRVAVLGEAETKAAPDTALITLSVITEGKQAVAAQQENARKTEAVTRAIESVTADTGTEIKTSDYSLNPERDYSSRGLPKIVGYAARNSVTVSVAALDRVGAVIDAATAAGANSVEGISFVVGEESPAQGGALAAASRRALAKAEALAAALGGRIVRVVQSTEGGIDPELVESGYAAMSNASVALERKPMIATPVRSGSVEMRSQVILVVDIETGR